MKLIKLFMSMRKMFQSNIFWSLFAAFTAVIFLLAVNTNRNYRSQARIIFLPKNIYIGNDMDAVLSNARQIAASVSFYDRMVEENQDIDDPAVQLPAYKRKEYWNNTVTVERVENSHVLLIQATNSDREQADLLASLTARDIALVMSKYYDIRSDLETRVIETAFSRSVSMAYNWRWFLASVAAGFVFSSGVFQISQRLKKNNRAKENLSRFDRRPPQPWYPLMGQQISSEKPSVQESVKEKSKPEKPREEVVPSQKAAPSLGKKSIAPGNLPVGNEFVLKKEPEYKKPEEEPKRILDHEATPEEVKKRLNKLLRGEM